MSTLLRIDRELLNEQRMNIVELLDKQVLRSSYSDNLQGVLHLLDAIQDHVDLCDTVGNDDTVELELRR